MPLRGENNTRVNMFSPNMFIYIGTIITCVGKARPLGTINRQTLLFDNTTVHKVQLNVSASLLLIITCIMSSAAGITTTSITFLQHHCPSLWDRCWPILQGL